MTRVLQCLFVFGLLLILAGAVQYVRRPMAAVPVELASPAQVSPVAAAPVPAVPSPILPSAPALPPVEEKEPELVRVKKTKVKPIVPVRKSSPPLLMPATPVKSKPRLPLALPGVPPLEEENSAQLKNDFNPDLLKNLPKPVKAPANVELPGVIYEDGQWSGSQSGLTQPVQMMFRNADSWKSFWSQAIAPYSSGFDRVPDVNFSKDMIAGVFLGDKPLVGYQIRITSAKTEVIEGTKTLVIRYKNGDRFLGIFTPKFQVQPFHLLKIPAFAGPVVFLEVKEVK